MSRAAFSIYVFVAYMVLMGGLLVGVPGFLNDLVMGDEPLQPATMRILGIVVLALAYYYWRAARSELTVFMRWTVHGRAFATAGWAVLVAAGLVPLAVALFLPLELGGAIWTWWALRADNEKELP